MEVTIEKRDCKASPERVQEHFSDENKTFDACPISNVLARISDKWSIHTIIALGKSDKRRFTHLKKEVHGISQRMLTVTLRNLEEDGLVRREIFAEIPPRVEYELTDLGRSLLAQLICLSDWADKHMMQILESRQNFERK